MTVDMEQYKDSGGQVDWDAYHKAQVEAGEVCRECGAYIVFSKGKPSLCVACNMMHQDKGEVSHSKRARCPHCAHLFMVQCDDGEVYSDGEHELMCPECDADFTITTTVSYSFSSPALGAGLPQIEVGDG